jgi:hypothetical protein
MTQGIGWPRAPHAAKHSRHGLRTHASIQSGGHSPAVVQISAFGHHRSRPATFPDLNRSSRLRTCGNARVPSGPAQICPKIPHPPESRDRGSAIWGGRTSPKLSQIAQGAEAPSFASRAVQGLMNQHGRLKFSGPGRHPQNPNLSVTCLMPFRSTTRRCHTPCPLLKRQYLASHPLQSVHGTVRSCELSTL